MTEKVVSGYGHNDKLAVIAVYVFDMVIVDIFGIVFGHERFNGVVDLQSKQARGKQEGKGGKNEEDGKGASDAETDEVIHLANDPCRNAGSILALQSSSGISSAIHNGVDLTAPDIILASTMANYGIYIKAFLDV
jgi:hypothetical protein